jgi:hypothetical protein
MRVVLARRPNPASSGAAAAPPVGSVLVSDIGSHAAAGDDTRANMNGGASSPGASDVLFAIGRSVGLRAARGRAGRPARRAKGDLRRAGAEILVGERKQVGGVLLPTRLEL